MIDKHQPFRSEPWLRAVRSLEYCVICGAYGVEAAHRNRGKGASMKTSDCLTAALCRECHTNIDQGKTMTREERRTLLDHAIILTVEKLAQIGAVGVL